MDYKSSWEAIDVLCEEHPSKPFRYGVGKAVAGTTLLGVGAASVAVPFVDMFADIESNRFIDGLAFVEGCAALYFGGKLFWDGVVSLGEATIPRRRSRAVVYRNGGFSHAPESTNNLRGLPIIPAYDSGAFETEDCGVFANGVDLNLKFIWDREGRNRALDFQTAANFEDPYNIEFEVSVGSMSFPVFGRGYMHSMQRFLERVGQIADKAYAVFRRNPKLSKNLDGDMELLFVGNAVRA